MINGGVINDSFFSVQNIFVSGFFIVEAGGIDDGGERYVYAFVVVTA